MEVRTSKGLTLRWFDVFLQTSMRKIGKDVLAILSTISQNLDAVAKLGVMY
jgi:hypothetical protein